MWRCYGYVTITNKLIFTAQREHITIERNVPWIKIPISSGPGPAFGESVVPVMCHAYRWYVEIGLGQLQLVEFFLYSSLHSAPSMEWTALQRFVTLTITTIRNHFLWRLWLWQVINEIEAHMLGMSNVIRRWIEKSSVPATKTRRKLDYSLVYEDLVSVNNKCTNELRKQILVVRQASHSPFLTLPHEWPVTNYPGSGICTSPTNFSSICQ